MMNKRIMAAVCVLLAVSMFFSACGGNEKESILNKKVDWKSVQRNVQPMLEDQSDLEWSGDTSPLTIKIWCGFSAYKSQMFNKDTLVAKEVMRETGINWEIDIPSGNETTALQMLVASGSLPDVVICPSSWPLVGTMIDGGKITPWSDLMDEYAPKMWNLLDDTMLEWFTLGDGKLYFVPSYVADESLVEKTLQKTNPAPFYVRSDIYTEMGRPDMSTPKTFEEVLVRVKKEYPDMIPLNLKFVYMTDFGFSPTFTNIFKGFGLQPQGSGGDQPTLVQVKDNEVKLPYRDPRYKEALKYCNSLYKKGIITDSLLIQRQSQIDQNLNNANYFCTSEAIHYVNQELNPTLKANFPDQGIQYELLDPAFAKEGITPKYQTILSKGWMAPLISSNAKNKDRIIKFFEYCLSERGQRTIILGKEGETYDLKDGEPALKPEIRALKNSNDQAALSKYGLISTFPCFIMPQQFNDYEREYSLRENKNFVADQEKANRYIHDVFKIGLGDIGPVAGTKDSVLYTKVVEKFSRSALKAIIAKSEKDFEKNFEDGVAEAKKAGSETIEKLLTENYLKNIENGVKSGEE